MDSSSKQRVAIKFCFIARKRVPLDIIKKLWSDFLKDLGLVVLKLQNPVIPDKMQFLLHENAPSHNTTIIKEFLAKESVTVFITNFLCYPLYSSDLVPVLTPSKVPTQM